VVPAQIRALVRAGAGTKWVLKSSWKNEVAAATTACDAG
jgi:hypothetical protein